MNFKKDIILCVLVLLVGVFFVVFFSPFKAFIAILGCLFLLCACIRPHWLILFLAVLIPLEPFVLKFVSSDMYIFARYASEMMVYALFLSACFRLRSHFLELKKSSVVFALVFLFFSIFISLALNVSTLLEVSILGTRQIVRFVLLFFVAFVFLKDRIWIRRFFILMFSLVLFESILGISQALSHGSLDSFLLPSGPKFFNEYQLTTGTNQFWEEGQRIFATLGRYDQLGTFLTFFLLFGLAFLYEHKNVRMKRVMLALFVCVVPALILTYSRASWFGFFLGLFVIAVFLKKDRRILIGCAVVFSIVGAYMVYTGIIVPKLIDAPRQTVTERFFEAFSFERWRGEYYGLGRLFFVVHTPPAILSHAPLFGLGPGTFGGGAATALHYTKQYDLIHLPFGIWGTEGFVDNNWLSLFGEIGIVGFTAYWIVFFFLFKESYVLWKYGRDDTERALGLGYMGVLCAVSFQAFLATYLEMRTLAVYFWLCGGMIARLAVENKYKQI